MPNVYIEIHIIPAKWIKADLRKRWDKLYLCSIRPTIAKMSTLSQWVCRSNKIPMQKSQQYFSQGNIITPYCIWRGRGNGIGIIVLKMKNKARRISLPIAELLIQLQWCGWGKDTQSNETEERTPKYPYRYTQLIFDKSNWMDKKGKLFFFFCTKWYGHKEAFTG